MSVYGRYDRRSWADIGAPLGYAPFVPARPEPNRWTALAVRAAEAATEIPEEPQRFDLEGLRAAFRAVTPTVVVLGLVTGIAFGLGGGLVSRYVFGTGR
jgi:hypothetical protein